MRCPACRSRAIAAGSSRHRRLCTACGMTFSRSRQTRLRRWAIVVGILLAASPLILGGITYALLSFLPADDGKPVDAIVVLGRGAPLRSDRTLAAAQLWAQGRSDRIFISGMGDALPILTQLKQMDAADAILFGERCSQTTWENGLYSKVVLGPQAVNRILLVTDPYHMVRSQWVFEEFGFDVIPHSVGYPVDSWWRQPYRLMVRELAALAAYRVSGKLTPQSADTREQAEATAIATIRGWGCQVNQPQRG